MQLEMEFPETLTSGQAWELVKANSKVGQYFYTLGAGEHAFEEIKKIAEFKTEEEMFEYIRTKNEKK